MHLPQLFLIQLTTEYDTINNCMKDFQDVVLAQNEPLWCDEGVYRTAKELQLLNSDGFGIIFLGLEGFHLEKRLSSPALGNSWKKVE